LALFQYDGSDISNGDSFDLENGVTSVEITAEATSNLSEVEIIGADALVPGRNVVKVKVTAQDTSVSTYLLFFNVAPNTITTLESLTVGGLDATSGAVTLPAGTRAAAVVAVTTDPFASFVVEGNTELNAGENTLSVTVTAADGEASDVVEVTVTVEETVLSDVTTLESLTVGGLDAIGGAVTLPAGTRAAVVVAVTTDPFASFVVEGNSELNPGDNTVTVTITAADGEASDVVEVTVTVEEVILSDDATLETFLVNGVDGSTGDPIDLPYGTTRVNVKVQTTDSTASYIVTGDGRTTPLVEGENTLTVTVTAANGDSESYPVTLNVLAISTNNNIDPDAGLFVNGEQVDLELLDNATGFVNLPVTATTVSIQVKAESDTSDVVANGKTLLPTVARVFGVEKGVNDINIQVIPQAGIESAKTYKLKVYVGGADATLKTLKVNTTTLTVGGDGTAALQTPLANGTTTATIFVEPTVAEAVGLGNGTKLEFDGGEATVTKGTVANTWNVAGLVTGENSISLTVTPGDANAEAGSYSIVIPVALSPDKRLKTFTVNGALVTVGSVIALAKGATSAEIDGSTESSVATYEVSGGDSLVIGRNTLTITVTAEDETTQSYTVTAIVPKQIDTIVIPFPKVGVVTVDKKTNVKGNAAITAALKKIKGTVGIVKITNNFLIAKDKVTAGPLRATNTQKYLAALKTNGFKTAIYQLVPDPNAKKAKGTTVTIYSY
jgi:predicted RNA methylase